MVDVLNAVYAKARGGKDINDSTAEVHGSLSYRRLAASALAATDIVALREIPPMFHGPKAWWAFLPVDATKIVTVAGVVREVREVTMRGKQTDPVTKHGWMAEKKGKGTFDFKPEFKAGLDGDVLRDVSSAALLNRLLGVLHKEGLTGSGYDAKKSYGYSGSVTRPSAGAYLWFDPARGTEGHWQAVEITAATSTTFDGTVYDPLSSAEETRTGEPLLRTKTEKGRVTKHWSLFKKIQ